MMSRVGFWRGLFLLVFSVLLTGVALRLRPPVAAQENRLTDGTKVRGQIESPASEERWVFEASAGDLVVLSIEPQTDSFVPLLTVTDPQGRLLMRVSYPATQEGEFSFTLGISRTGSHTVRVQGDVQTTGAYALGFAVVEQSAAPDDRTLLYGRSAEGQITDDTFRTTWTFAGSAGDVVDVFMRATGGDLDPFVTLLAPDGTVLASADSGGEGNDAALFAVRLPVSGTYTVVARRSGANSGADGRTTGSFQVLVSLRQAGVGAETFEPVLLTVGTATRGQLTRAAPVMRYALQAQGNIVFTMQVSEPAQGVQLAIYADDVLLDTVAGFGRFAHRFAVPPGSESVLVEVSPLGTLIVEAVDFRLDTAPLSTSAGLPAPLFYGEGREVAGAEGNISTWYMTAEAGDVVMLQLWPYDLDPGMLRVIAPDETPVLVQTIQGNTRQALVLEQSGLYLIALDKTLAESGYRIQVDLQGKRWRSFEQRLAERVPQPLPVGETSAELEPGLADVWLIDNPEQVPWQFVLTQQSGASALVMDIEAPDGQSVGVAVTDPFLRTASLYPDLSQKGRYRIRVFALDGQSARYSLRAVPGSGGALKPGQRVKGVINADSIAHIWWLDAPPGAVLSLDLQSAPGHDTVDVAVLSPEGLLLASSARGDELNGILLREGGRYRVLVAKPGVTSRLVYYLRAELVGESLFSAHEAMPVVLLTESPPVEQVSIPDLIIPAWQVEIPVQTALPLTLGVPLRGEISEGYSAQHWTVSARAGQTLLFTALPVESESPIALALFDPDGVVVAEGHQAGGAVTLTHSFLTAGEYRVAVGMRNAQRYVLWAEEVSNFDPRAERLIQGTVVTLGSTTRATLGPETPRQTFVFWGQAGDTIVASVSALSDFPLEVTLLDAAGNPMPGGARQLRLPRLFSVQATLPADGVYQVIVTGGDRVLTVPLPFDIHLSLVSNAQGRTPNGGALNGTVTGALSGTGGDHWLFAGTAGQRVRAQVILLDDGGDGPLVFSLADSAGMVFAQRRAYFGQRALVLDSVILPYTGVYQAIVEGDVGRYHLSIEGNSAQQQTSSVALSYGATASGVLAATDVLDAWTWSGSRGDVVRVTARQTAGTPALLTIQVRARDGSVLATAVAGLNSSAQIEHLELPLDGHYTLLIGSPAGDIAGLAYAATVQLESSAAHSMGQIIAAGERWRGALTIDDPIDTWLIEAGEGETLIVSVSPQEQRFSPTLALVATDWHLGGFRETPAVLAEAQSINGQPVELSYTFAVPGPYAVMVTTPSRSYGMYEIAVTKTAQAFSQRLRSGRTYRGELGEPVLSNVWNFEGQAGDLVTVEVAPDSHTPILLRMALVAPDGSTVAQSQAQDGRGVTIAGYPLPVGGNYTVIVSVADGASPDLLSGHYTLSFQQETNTRPVPRPVQEGRPVFDALGREEPAQWWTFSGRMGETVRITARATSGSLDPVLALYDASGRLLAEADDTEVLDATLTFALPQDGDFLVRISRYAGISGSTSGNYSLLLERPYNASAVESESAPLFYGERVEGVLDRQLDQVRWVFWGAAGDTVAVAAHFPADDVPLLLTLSDPAGTVLATGLRDGGSAIIDGFELPADGFYFITLRRPADVRSAFSPYAVTLEVVDWQEQQPIAPGALSAQRPGVARIGAGQTHFWQFAGTAGDVVACTVMVGEAPLALDMSIYGPDGQVLARAEALPGTAEALHTGTLLLPLSGTYTVTVQARPQAPQVTTYRLLLQEAMQLPQPDVTVKPGQDVLGQLDDFNPSDEWQLELRREDSIQVRLSVLSGDLQPAIVLLDPAGRPVAQSRVEHTGSTGELVIGPLRVSESGSYAIVVMRQGGFADTTGGRYRLNVWQGTVSSQVMAAQEMTFGVPLWDNVTEHERRMYRFSALAGDVVAISVLRTEGSTLPHLALETEDGRPIPVQIVSTEDELAIPQLVVGRTGYYLIDITSDGPVGFGLYITRLPLAAPAEGPVRQLGTDVRLVESIQAPGEATRWRFAGTQGEVLTFTVTSASSQLIPDIALYGPMGYLAGATALLTGDAVLGPIRLPETGEYTLVVRSWQNAAGAGVGEYRVFAERAPEDISGSSGGTLPVAGRTVYGGLISTDPVDSWQIEGKAGENLVIQIETSRPEETVELALLTPNGATLATHLVRQDARTFEVAGLPADGAYTLRVAARSTADFPIEYRLAAAVAANLGTVEPGNPRGIGFGQPAQGALSRDEAAQTWVFYGQAGQMVEVVGALLSAAPNASVSLSLVDGSGETLQGGMLETSRRDIVVGPVPLTRTGFYGVAVRADSALLMDTAEIAYEIEIVARTPGATDKGVLEGTVSGRLSDGSPAHEWQFAPAFSGTYRLRGCSRSPGREVALIVLARNGDTVGQGNPDEYNNHCQLLSARFEAGEQYRVVVANPAMIGELSYSLELMPESYENRGMSIRPGEQDVGRLDDRHFADQWVLRGRGGQNVEVTISVSTGALAPVVEAYDSSAKMMTGGTLGDEGRVIARFRLPPDGLAYLIVAREGKAGGISAGDYALTVTSVED